MLFSGFHSRSAPSLSFPRANSIPTVTSQPTIWNYFALYRRSAARLLQQFPRNTLTASSLPRCL
ncbi:hypothetical protein [Acetobacter sicerae]|uniref:hypothetical protein n=1 Tax=Acetobacter sicerae TaxID=85325 RepID=UPI001F557321|nr:hypothetical protein [Acetobacter sicerae]